VFPGLTQGLRRAAQLKANEVAVSDQHRCCTWQRLIERISRLAGGFRELGLQQNDRVAYLAYNDHRSLEVFYAALWAGGIIAPLNTRLNADDLNALLEIIEPRLIVAAPEFAELAKELDVPVAVPISQGQALGAGHYEAIIRATAIIGDGRRCTDDGFGVARSQSVDLCQCCFSPRWKPWSDAKTTTVFSECGLSSSAASSCPTRASAKAILAA